MPKLAVVSKKETYHIGCPYCKEGFVVYNPPPLRLHCPYCGMILLTMPITEHDKGGES